LAEKHTGRKILRGLLSRGLSLFAAMMLEAQKWGDLKDSSCLGHSFRFDARGAECETI
jgi:hypothetical protein